MGWANFAAIAGTVIACVTAVVTLIIQAIRGANPQEYHDRQTCMCPACRRMRYKAMKKSGHRVEGIAPDGSVVWSNDPPMEGKGDGWITTAQLEEGMVVTYRGINYRVLQVRVFVKGYVINLQNLGSRRDFLMEVKFGDANRPYWYVFNRPGEFRDKGPGWKW